MSAKRILQLTIDGEAIEVKPERTRRREEAQHQAALFTHIRLNKMKYPLLHFIFSTLNGLPLSGKVLAAAIEAGLACGILDIWGPIRRVDADGKVWSGIVIDLKKLKNGRPSMDQLKWAAHLVEQGYRVYFCEGCVDAWRCLCCYLGISGRDHIALELAAQENLIRLTNQI